MITLTPEKLISVLDGMQPFKAHTVKNFYMNPVTFGQLYEHLSKPLQADLMQLRTVNAVLVVVDPCIDQNDIFHCTAKEFEIYRSLKTDSFLDPKIDILKVTAALYDTYVKEQPTIDNYFKPGYL